MAAARNAYRRSAAAKASEKGFRGLEADAQDVAVRLNRTDDPKQNNFPLVSRRPHDPGNRLGV